MCVYPPVAQDWQYVVAKEKVRAIDSICLFLFYVFISNLMLPIQLVTYIYLFVST